MTPTLGPRIYIATFREALGPRLIRRVIARAKSLGMSRQDLCDTAEISKQFLTNLLHGDRRLTPEMGDRLMAAVDLTMEEYQQGTNRAMYKGGYLPKSFAKINRRSAATIKALRTRMLKAEQPPVVYGRMV